ncbi:MAG: aconitase X [Acidiferrobacterales bacterium]
MLQHGVPDTKDFILSAEEEATLAGDHGHVCQWAIAMQIEVGRFFGAHNLVEVTCAHMMGDMEVMGEAGLILLKRLAMEGTRVVVPTTTNARCVDFAAAERLLQDPELVAKERELMGYLRNMGVMLTDTCVNYQTLYQPHSGEHIAWGDTGTVIYANSVLGARSNFESGPAAFAAAITGRTPNYGFHLDECRLGTVLVEVEAELNDLADWGALGAVVGREVNDYWQVPVFTGITKAPISDQLKHLGASLASYGSLAMFHMIGVTPGATNVDEVCGGRVPTHRITADAAAIEAVYASYPADRAQMDAVVLTGPQLSLFELRLVAELLAGRRVHADTAFIITTNRQNYEAAKALGYVTAIEKAGGLVLIGVCFYLMAAGEIRKKFGWSNVLTNSAKFANIISGYRYRPILRRTRDCVEAAITGKLAA